MAADPKKLLADYLGKKVVLVVEPSTNYRNSIKQFLINLKVKQLKMVSTVAEARREMLTLKVGLFIVEWGLEETNGLQFCRALRKDSAHKDTAFLLLSVENLRQDVILASEVSIDGYLLKPFSYEDFSAQIHAIIKAKTAPNPVNDLLDAGDKLLAAGDLDRAEKCYRDVILVKDRSARGLVGLARVLQQRDDAKGAMAMLTTAASTNPDYIEAYRVMLEISEQEGDRSGTIQAASVLHSLSPDNPRYSLILAKAYLDMEHLDGSEQFFKRTLALSPRLAEAYKGLGHVYLAKDECDKAMKNFKKALDLDADDISTLNSLGMTYVRLNEYKLGIDKYMIALKLDPHDFRVLFNIGHAHEKKGDLEKAKWFYSQSLIHKHGYEKALRGLDRLKRGGEPVPPEDDADEVVPPKPLKKSG